MYSNIYQFQALLPVLSRLKLKLDPLYWLSRHFHSCGTSRYFGSTHEYP